VCLEDHKLIKIVCHSRLNKATKFIKQNNFLATSSRTGSEDVPHVLWKKKVDYRIDTSPPLDSVLCQMRILTPYFFKVCLNVVSYLRLGLPGVFFLSDYMLYNLCS
jgi:hypothetical protein